MGEASPADPSGPGRNRISPTNHACTLGSSSGNMAQEPTVRQLLAGITQHDESALAQLYDLAAPGLFGLITEIISDSEAAREILHHVLDGANFGDTEHRYTGGRREHSGHHLHPRFVVLLFGRRRRHAADHDDGPRQFGRQHRDCRVAGGQ